MEEKYYKVEDCQDLSAELLDLEDTFKYLVSLPKDHEDAKLLTSELVDAYEDVINACKDLISAFDYYSKKI